MTKRSPDFTKPASWIRSVPMSPRGSPKWNGGNTQRARRVHQRTILTRAETLRGEGEGARRRLVMEADGALEKKLQAHRGQQAHASAIKDYKGNWVPGVVMGGGNGTHAAGSGAQELIDLLTIKTARDLGLDISIRNLTSRVDTK